MDAIRKRLLHPKQIFDGHRVVLPTRDVSRIGDLTRQEFQGMLLSVRDVVRRIGSTCDAFNVAIQDGRSAGNPVDRLFAHVVPRIEGDLTRNDDIYDILDDWTPSGEKNKNRGAKLVFPNDKDRKARTIATMAAEARRYREELNAIDASTSRNFQSFATHRPSIKFGPFDVTTKEQVFYASPSGLSFALVNLKPLVEGHVLVCPTRVTARLADLTDDEIRDVADSVVRIQNLIRRAHGATGFNVGIQDGKHAGQSVPHVHVHLLPRGST